MLVVVVTFLHGLVGDSGVICFSVVVVALGTEERFCR